MALTQQPPDFRTPLFDDSGHIALVWQRFFLALTTNLSANVAPATAPFVVTHADLALTAAINLGLLSSGYLKIAVASAIATLSAHATVPATDLSGTLPAAVEPAHTGDVTNPAGSLALTLAATAVTPAAYGSASAIPTFTVDQKGRLTAASSVALLPRVVASAFETSETGSDANVLTYTVGGADEAHVVMVMVDVSAITGTSVTATVTWKDSNNATATTSVVLTATGDGTINVPINAHTATNVVVSTVFVGVTTAYKISAFVLRVK